MNQLLLKDVPTLINVFNKLVNIGDIPQVVKLQTMRILEKLAFEEKKFLDEKDKIVNKYVLRDENNNPITYIQKENNIPLEMYDFGDKKAEYENAILPLLNTPVARAAQNISMTIEDLAATPLTIRDIDILKYYGYTKENKGVIVDVRNKKLN